MFSDLVAAPVEARVLKCISMPTDGADWRRGYYAQRRWLVEKPKPGIKSTMMLRFEEQRDYDIEEDEHMTSWERTTLAMVRRQALRRARQQRLSSAVRKRIEDVLKGEDDPEVSAGSGDSD